jgi:hypothetical protein
VAIYYLFNNKFKQHFIWWQSNVKQKWWDETANLDSRSQCLQKKKGP